jgi:hypothetical protein
VPLAMLVDTILKMRFYWSINFKGHEFGISILKVEQLHQIGFQIVNDVWNAQT